MGATYTSQWFTACKQDDVYAVKKLMGYFAGRRDKKNMLTPNNERFVGFTGLLYACYANAIEVVKELLPYEHALPYEGGGELEVISTIPNVSELGTGQDICIIRPGTTCLQLSVLRGHYEVAQLILAQLSGRPGALSGLKGRQDTAGVATLDSLVLQPCQAAFTTFRVFKDYFLDSEVALERPENLNPATIATFTDNKPFLFTFLALTTHQKYGEPIQRWFRHINVDTATIIARTFGQSRLASQNAINQNLAQIRLMQAGDPPPIPDWLLNQSTSRLTTSSTLNNRNTLLTSPFQTVTLRSSNRKTFTLNSNFYTTNHLTNQTDIQKTLNTTSTREVEVTPKRKRRYELFTDVYASPHSQSAVNLRNKYITIIDDEESDGIKNPEQNGKGNQQQNNQKHNLRMCDFHRSFEANSDFTDTEDSQQLVLDDN